MGLIVIFGINHLIKHTAQNISLIKHYRRLSPLRYPGGKSQMTPIVLHILKQNNLLNCDYIEPFAGGAGVAIGLLLSEAVKSIHINDIDIGVYSFWKSILDDTDEFLYRLNDVDVNMDEWYLQKDILMNMDQYSKLDIGFATFFLNRTNRSGILKAGVIGGKQQSGKYKLDARFNKKNLADRIKEIVKYKERIHIYNCDANQFIENIEYQNMCNPFIYLDPPYYKKGQGLYRNYYLHCDHISIKKMINSINIPWIVSYDNCQEIINIYEDFIPYFYNLNYSAQIKKTGSEVMFFSSELQVPILEHI